MPIGQTATEKCPFFSRFFKIAAVYHLVYLKVRIFNIWYISDGPMVVTVPHFVPIGQTIAEIWPIGRFPIF